MPRIRAILEKSLKNDEPEKSFIETPLKSRTAAGTPSTAAGSTPETAAVVSPASELASPVAFQLAERLGTTRAEQRKAKKQRKKTAKAQKQAEESTFPVAAPRTKVEPSEAQLAEEQEVLEDLAREKQQFLDYYHGVLGHLGCRPEEDEIYEAYYDADRGYLAWLRRHKQGLMAPGYEMQDYLEAFSGTDSGEDA